MGLIISNLHLQFGEISSLFLLKSLRMLKLFSAASFPIIHTMYKTLKRHQLSDIANLLMNSLKKSNKVSAYVSLRNRRAHNIRTAPPQQPSNPIHPDLNTSGSPEKNWHQIWNTNEFNYHIIAQPTVACDCLADDGDGYSAVLDPRAPCVDVMC